MNTSPSTAGGGNYVALVSVGPGDRELERLADLVVSLLRFEAKELSRIIVVDDVPEPRDYQKVTALLPPGCLRVLFNPRRSRGDGWSGGLAANVVFGLAAARLEGRSAYVLKLDTDSFVIGPFHERLVSFFRANSTCGVAGSCYALDLHGQATLPSTWKVNLVKWQRPMRLRRNPFPRLEQGFVGVNRQIRDVINASVQVGAPFDYRLGNCAQGGGYAVRRETLDALHTRGWLQGSWWSRTDLGEDVVTSLLSTAVGWRVCDFNQPGEVFGVQFKGLAFSPDELRARGFGIVHSVKCSTWEAEQLLRERFRAAPSPMA